MEDLIFWTLAAYLAVINLLSFILIVADKHRAKQAKWRISERTLLLVDFFGGSLGGLIAMLLVRHKTQKPKFMITVPLFLILQIALVIYYFF
jgi:Predicted membrane protein